MNVYKVFFKNNKAQSVIKKRKSYYSELVKMNRNGTYLVWLYLHADNEKEAMEKANNYRDGIMVQVRNNYARRMSEI